MIGFNRRKSEFQQEIRLHREFVSDGEVALLSFFYTWKRLEKLGQALFSRFGLSDAQFNVLTTLANYPETGVRQFELAELLIVNRASIGGVIDRMEREKWIERRRDPEDRRSNYVHLTAAGQHLLEQVRPAYYALFAPILGHLDERRQQDLTELLALLRAGIADAEKTLE